MALNCAGEPPPCRLIAVDSSTDRVTGTAVRTFFAGTDVRVRTVWRTGVAVGRLVDAAFAGARTASQTFRQSSLRHDFYLWTELRRRKVRQSLSSDSIRAR